MDAVVTTANEPQAVQDNAPQLRTILLTDICDSTMLVERLGDNGTAQFFREHDRLVVRLQQQWRGRLIDRSDGLLLLFERPIDGLGFALDYARGLGEVGKLRDLDVKTRAGLHVGEVLTWRNSDEAVRLGSKPVEVEGLAKPMAARLMTIARPGQVLLSAVAEPLAHRAARELGERGQHMIWKSHGRWRFKGVPEPQEIFEVGEPGVAPLRTPPNSPKAWRDIPLWRRPAALMTEVALLTALAVGGWVATRPGPAIAFNERDWVVVGDLRNLTGDTRLDDSLEQAFRISLEQSRHVNVLSDLKVRDTLSRMRLEPDTVVDRDIASEVALRDGARAVILPTVAEIGGRLRMSVEVIDPATQTTVYAHAADGRGEESVLASIDEVTGALRSDLGEAVEQIERDSRPLPEVTTSSVDALRAYALAQEAYGRYEFDKALQLYRRAAELDPEFALAWLGQMRSLLGTVDAPAAVESLRKARALKGKLPPREALYVDAWASEFENPPEATGRWVQLASMYPDYLPGRGNAALWLYEENRFKEALPHAMAGTIEQNPLRGQEFDTVGRVQLAMEAYAEAERALKRSFEEVGGSSLRRIVSTAAAQRDFKEAESAAKRLDPANAHHYMEQTSLAIDQAKLQEARRLSRASLRVLKNKNGLASRYLAVPMALSDWLTGDVAEARKTLQSVVRASLGQLGSSKEGLNVDAEDDATTALAAALVLQRMGEHASAESVLAKLEEQPVVLRIPAVSELATVLRAEKLRHGGEAEKAIELLQPLISGSERYQTRVALMEAFADAGRLADAREQAGWLQRRRGLAYAELECGSCMQALNVLDSNLAIRREAQLLRADGRDVEADRKLEDFNRLWPAEVLPPYFSES